MKKVLNIVMVVIVMGITMNSCTENQRAKNWGGTAKIVLPKHQKLVITTWKDDNLWYLTREMREDEKAETYTFVEDANFGIMNGKVILFVEVK